MSAVYRALKGLLHREVALGLTPLQKWLFSEIFCIFLPASSNSFKMYFRVRTQPSINYQSIQRFCAQPIRMTYFWHTPIKGLLYIKGPLSVKHLVKKPFVYSLLSKWLPTNKHRSFYRDLLWKNMQITLKKFYRSITEISINKLREDIQIFLKKVDLLPSKRRYIIHL